MIRSMSSRTLHQLHRFTACAADITPENSGVVAHIYEVAAQIAAKEGISDGFRIITNCGENAGQTVHHLHFHMLAGVKMGWGKESVQAAE